MYHFETNTFCYVRKSKIRITDSYEFIWHMHECKFNFVYLYVALLSKVIKSNKMELTDTDKPGHN